MISIAGDSHPLDTICQDAAMASSPTALQIALGGFIGIATDFHVELTPDVFFLLFLPPLLFLDGWRIPKEEMLKDIKPILELCLGWLF
jgi:NhaP-type Na+/H+ or K+/H+ antiporter